MRLYYVYILKCSDQSYYIGITNDYEHRLYEHQSGIHKTCYTFNKRPVILVYLTIFSNVMQAIAWEKQIKRWSRKKKEALINADWENLPDLAICQNATHSKNYSSIACHTERSRSAMRYVLFL